MSNSIRDPVPGVDSSALRVALHSGPIAAVGFWTGIALPFLYIPLLLVGPSGSTETTIAFALIAVHALALFVGHTHRQDDGAEA